MNGVCLPGFSDESLIRRVHRENVVLLGGGRALLLQVAHPAVADAVASHSSFRDHRVARLLATLRPTLAIVFGSPAQVREAAAAINLIHGQISGPHYRATDPELLFWVLATLIDTALMMHARFLRPLIEAEAESYYADMLAAGALLGVEVESAPPDVAAFHVYMARTLDGLRVSDGAKEIARDLFAAPPPFGLAFAGLRALTSGLLPQHLRRGFGLDWGERSQVALEKAEAFSRLLLPRLPRALRSPPPFLLPPPA